MGGLVSIFVSKEYSSSLTLLLIYFSFGLLFFVTRYFLTSLTNIDKTLTVLILSMLIVATIVHFAGLSDDPATTWRTAGGSGNPNRFASIILVILPLILYRVMHSSGILKLLFFVSIGGFVILLIYSGSRGGMLGF
ncbi:MAG: hypothetical protein O6943_06335, partial [Bacteroidetes bacterium]|nr:hypothetical protein [Bacteroidota bacterium]